MFSSCVQRRQRLSTKSFYNKMLVMDIADHPGIPVYLSIVHPITVLCPNIPITKVHSQDCMVHLMATLSSRMCLSIPDFSSIVYFNLIRILANKHKHNLVAILNPLACSNS